MAFESNFKGLIDAVLRRSDQPEAPDSMREKAGEFVNDAIDIVAMEAPYLFNEGFVKLVTEPDLVPASDADTMFVDIHDISAASSINPYVLLKTLDTTQPQTALPYDRSLDGRLIDITGPDGIIHRNQIRSVWKETNYNSTGLDYYAISLMRPLDYFMTGSQQTSPFTGELDWRIYTQVYYFQDDVVELKAMRVVGTTMPAKIDVISQDEAERSGLLDLTGADAGATPMWAWRRGHYQLPGTNTAPDVAQGPTASWLGPEPPGTFQYCYTLAWGKLDVDYEAGGIPIYQFNHLGWSENDADSASQATFWGVNRMREPRFESAPSPVTDEITVDHPIVGQASTAFPAGVVLTFPNLEYELGFLMKGSHAAATFDRSSSSHSGLHIRIYRRRLSADFVNYDAFSAGGSTTGVTSLSKLDIQDDYFLLAEFRVDSFNAAQFTDSGVWIPDKNRRLRNSHGYMGFMLYPNPDARYEIESRVIRRPTRLVSDSDVPTVHAGATKLIVDRSLVMMYELLKDQTNKLDSMREYERSLQNLVKRYSDLRPATQPIKRQPARSRRYARATTPWWRSN